MNVTDNRMKKKAYITPISQIYTLSSHCMVVAGSSEVKFDRNTDVDDEDEDDDPNGSRRFSSFHDEEW